MAFVFVLEIHLVGNLNVLLAAEAVHLDAVGALQIARERHIRRPD